jgi:sialate O-acetylesterase
MKITGNESITLRNILVGEVWVCSGQSNMEFGVGGADNAPQEIAAAKWPKIRLFTVPKAISWSLLTDCKSSWVECSPQTVGGFSAVGYFFGRDVHKALNVPVGLINSSWGGTIIETWTPLWAFKADPYYQSVVDWRNKVYAENVSNNPNVPTVLYNGMIEPIRNFALRGALWYQGESNAGDPKGYRKRLPTLIESWRKAWRNPQLAFMIVQLANFMAVQTTPIEDGWAGIRESMMMTAQTVPGAGLGSAIDIGDAADIHPRNKQEVGRRLALSALALIYGRKTEYWGPTFDRMTVEGNKATIHFTHTTGGLVVKGGELKGFAIRGASGDFVWAKGKVQGNTLVLWADGVDRPAAVRYDWANNPVGNLYNGFGLPANPFRTDVD